MRRREFVRAVTGSVAFSTVGSAALSTAEMASASSESYRPLGRAPIANATDAVLGPENEVAYVAVTDGFAVVDLSDPSEPLVVTTRRNFLADREMGPLRQIHDLAVEGDRLMVVGPARPSADDVLRGAVVFDVSDPVTPQLVAFHETDFSIRNCDLRDGTAYLTGTNGDGNPLVMVDVGGDEPAEVGRWSLLDYDERWGQSVPGLRRLHDVSVQGDRAYLSLWDAGTWILDVSDPAEPMVLGNVGGRSAGDLAGVGSNSLQADYFSLPGNANEAMASEDGNLLAVGMEAWESGGSGSPGGVELWDISDLEQPTREASIGAPPTSDATISGRWTTAHEFDLVDGRLFTSWYQGGVKIHDVSDPANPEELAWWRDHTEASFWSAERANSDFFVASASGQRAIGTPGLYTFPNRAGQQQDALSLTQTPTPVPTQTTNSDSDSMVRSTTRDVTTRAVDESSDDDSSAGGVPGFGGPAAVGALLSMAGWKRFRD